ncbi:MAG: peptidoglycan binding protein CsiV, partial [Gammaproteobacteria bacterium]|nr:peptidoglycan binding protein CsiV [Gammaproteobacteria bacterium]
GIRDRMRRLDVYDPVMHFGWTQVTRPEEQTAAIPLARFAPPPPGLEGELTLYLNRFLHLVVDLALEAPKSKVFNVEEQARLGDVRTVGELLDEVNAQASTYYRIQEDRILRNGELRYYDHPKFGVLAKVTRVEDEVEKRGEIDLLGYGSE